MESIESWNELEVSCLRPSKCVDHTSDLNRFCVQCREYFCRQCKHEHRLENINQLLPQIYEYCEEMAEESAHLERRF